MKPIPDGFKGAARPLSDDAIESAASLIGCDIPTIMAVKEVETGGRPFFDNEGRPYILFERHKFSKFTNGVHNKTNPDISNPIGGGYGPVSGQYAKLDRAMRLGGIEAALKSCSFGAFQIMGFNAQSIGYMGPVHMVAAFCESADNQLDGFIKFVLSRKLDQYLRDKNWKKFAFWYNGEEFEKFSYHMKLEKAYEKFK